MSPERRRFALIIFYVVTVSSIILPSAFYFIFTPIDEDVSCSIRSYFGSSDSPVSYVTFDIMLNNHGIFNLNSSVNITLRFWNYGYHLGHGPPWVEINNNYTIGIVHAGEQLHVTHYTWAFGWPASPNNYSLTYRFFINLM